jgi:glycosyltransferase involved in cell wall biosynthesis
MDGADRRGWHLYESMVQAGVSGAFVGRTVVVRELNAPRWHSPQRSWRDWKPLTAQVALATGRDYWQLKHLLPGARRTVSELAHERYDVVLVSILYSLPLARVFIERGVPLVVDTHNYDAGWYSTLAAASKNALLRLLCARAIRTSERALASLPRGTVLVHVSETDASRYRRHRPDLRHVVVENGTTVRPRQKAPDYAAPRKPVLIFVGSLSAQMNQDALRHFALRFWKELREAAEFRVIGSNPPRNIQHLCWEQGWDLRPNVSQDQLEQLYSEAHFAVLPFEYGEGSKLKFLEACGRGVPVLATAAGLCGFSEAPALVTTSDSPAAWAERLQARSEPSADEVRSLVAFAQEFSWPNLARKLANIMQETLAKPPLKDHGLLMN